MIDWWLWWSSIDEIYEVPDDHDRLMITNWSSIDDKTKLLMIMIFYLFLLFPALGHQNRHNLRFLFFWGFFLRLCFLPTLLCHPPPLRKVDSRKKSKTTTSPRKENVQLSSKPWLVLPAYCLTCQPAGVTTDLRLDKTCRETFYDALYLPFPPFSFVLVTGSFSQPSVRLDIWL